jgi:hypothetical protein
VETVQLIEQVTPAVKGQKATNTSNTWILSPTMTGFAGPIRACIQYTSTQNKVKVGNDAAKVLQGMLKSIKDANGHASYNLSSGDPIDDKINSQMCIMLVVGPSAAEIAAAKAAADAAAKAAADAAAKTAADTATKAAAAAAADAAAKAAAVTAAQVKAAYDATPMSCQLNQEIMPNPGNKTGKSCLCMPPNKVTNQLGRVNPFCGR